MDISITDEIRQLLDEGKAAEKAKSLGLVSAGWGWWKTPGKKGKVVAHTVGDQLVSVSGVGTSSGTKYTMATHNKVGAKLPKSHPKAKPKTSPQSKEDQSIDKALSKIAQLKAGMPLINDKYELEQYMELKITLSASGANLWWKMLQACKSKDDVIKVGDAFAKMHPDPKDELLHAWDGAESVFINRLKPNGKMPKTLPTPILDINNESEVQLYKFTLNKIGQAKTDKIWTLYSKCKTPAQVRSDTIDDAVRKLIGNAGFWNVAREVEDHFWYKTKKKMADTLESDATPHAKTLVAMIGYPAAKELWGQLNNDNYYSKKLYKNIYLSLPSSQKEKFKEIQKYANTIRGSLLLPDLDDLYTPTAKDKKALSDPKYLIRTALEQVSTKVADIISKPQVAGEKTVAKILDYEHEDQYVHGVSRLFGKKQIALDTKMASAAKKSAQKQAVNVRLQMPVEDMLNLKYAVDDWQGSSVWRRPPAERKKIYATMDKYIGGSKPMVTSVAGPIFRGMTIEAKDLKKFLSNFGKGKFVTLPPSGFSAKAWVTEDFVEANGDGIGVFIRVFPNEDKKLVGFHLHHCHIPESAWKKKLPPEPKESDYVSKLPANPSTKDFALYDKQNDAYYKAGNEWEKLKEKYESAYADSDLNDEYEIIRPSTAKTRVREITKHVFVRPGDDDVYVYYTIDLEEASSMKNIRESVEPLNEFALPVEGAKELLDKYLLGSFRHLLKKVKKESGNKETLDKYVEGPEHK